MIWVKREEVGCEYRRARQRWCVKRFGQHVFLVQDYSERIGRSERVLLGAAGLFKSDGRSARILMWISASKGRVQKRVELTNPCKKNSREYTSVYMGSAQVQYHHHLPTLIPLARRSGCFELQMVSLAVDFSAVLGEKWAQF